MREIAKTLGMKSLEDILAETETEVEVEQDLPVVVVEAKGTELMSTGDMRGSDHGKSMDEIYDESLDIARKITDMGMNIDPAKAPRMFEVAGQFFKTALDAKNSKRDAQMKLMKLIQDQKKLEMEERRLNGEIGNKESLEGEVVFEGDRNKLLKMLKAAKADKPEEEPRG